MKHYHDDYAMHLSRIKQDVAGLLCTSDLKTYFSFGDSIQFLKVEKITTHLLFDKGKSIFVMEDSFLEDLDDFFSHLYTNIC